ncbi:DUF4349 domain-containing protein [Flavivirga spongiicola]|uniref:DUF4349 domain-containing protein n=1 Tax=Flavivirga spongiicola TaxID=421621 RepID=A0ABU7XT93_9FLAO|nr:DUF4349 domain-containing protein [Flavivirga sp. MEBiC05379]MDO5978077.1 DUF4349 domain-containing protein [Flavivirga sp. MEBiC05379]
MNVKQFNSVLKISVFALLCLSIGACNQAMENKDYALSKVDVTEEHAAYGTETNDDVSLSPQAEIKMPKELKIIKSAKARYKVANVKMTTHKIRQLAGKYEAYISDLRFENNLHSIENRFTIKVPKQYFDVLMDSIKNIVEFVEYENVTTKDVSEEYVDLETRLKTKLEVKQRYETILRKKAKTVEDILATEEKLRIIQEEIESAQGRLKFLTNKVAYSTIQIDLYETVAYKEAPESYSKTFLSKTKEGFSFGWNIIKSIVLGIIYLWPIAVLSIFIFFFVRKRLRKKV